MPDWSRQQTSYQGTANQTLGQKYGVEAKARQEKKHATPVGMPAKTRALRAGLRFFNRSNS